MSVEHASSAVVVGAARFGDGALLAQGAVVRAGAVVKQRSQFAACTVVDGFPAVEVGRLDGPPARPAWAFASLDELPRLVR